MRKYKGFIIGLIVGIVLATSGTVFADSLYSMIGKKVDMVYPVYVNGNRLQVDAISIEGKSYIPTTDYAATVGYAVYFDGVGKRIDLNSEVPGVKLITKSNESKLSDDPNISTIITGDGTYNVTIDPTMNRQEQEAQAMKMIIKNNELTKAQSELIRLQQSLDGAHQSYLDAGGLADKWGDAAIYKSYLSDIAAQQSKIAQLQAEINALQ